MKHVLRTFLLVVLVLTLVTGVASAAYVYESRYGHNTLKRGHTGAYVQNLQTDLNAVGFSCGTADGTFDSRTESAVELYQGARGLSVDGQAGYNTKTKLWYEEGQYH